jgi:hypothetical protein
MMREIRFMNEVMMSERQRKKCVGMLDKRETPTYNAASLHRILRRKERETTVSPRKVEQNVSFPKRNSCDIILLLKRL